MMKQDIVIRAVADGEAGVADNEAIAQTVAHADEYSAAEHDGERLRVHLILRNQSLVDALRKTSLSGNLMNNLELYCYSFSDLYAVELLGIKADGLHKIDFKPVTVDSNQTVHVVLIGATAQAESIAMHTAQIAHYPNYCRDNALKTRITMVATDCSDFDNFKMRNSELLANSYLRDVLVEDEQLTTKAFAPKYATTRRDFVDLEWEFVTGNISNKVLSYKFQKWADDSSQLTTFVYCGDDESENLSNALNLARQTASTADYQIFIKTADDAALHLLKQSGQYENLYAFGGENVDYDSLGRYIKMAQLVNFAYFNMRESTVDEIAQGQTSMVVATDMPDDKLLNHIWNRNDQSGCPKINTQKRWSNIYNAYSIPSKMRSIGLDAGHWHDLYAISDKDVDLLAEVEHNRWIVEELSLGFVPTSDEEHAEILADVSKREFYKKLLKHDDLRNYRDLGVDDSGKSVTRYDVALVRSIPLIAYSYHHKYEDYGNK